ncbi:helix-turn-helix domain-containing protein [Bacillus cereus]|uniref:helix-turn-helix domain-containing protein n=1 Tax=Bacillus cereus TaxID=1396 RepID=UPI0018F40FA1|nr:helix-turn-helix domain-containing protein [Bacillus cereus]MBJ7966974.1 helix-turn-helix domain-containing protein [Bacillus cereus]MBJ8003371.1 helix-turn-helix domain-containing protein [Bacillus cereus]
MFGNQEKMLSIKETAELLGMGKSTLSKKLQVLEVEGIERGNNRVLISVSIIPKLKGLLDYNDEFDKGTYFSTDEVVKRINEKGLKVKRTDISNWIKKGKVNSILHMGYRYIHENDLNQLVEVVINERDIPDGFCTIEEAASLTGRHPQTIKGWASQGEIESKSVVLNHLRKIFVKRESLQVVKKKKRINMLKNFAYVDIALISDNPENNMNNEIPKQAPIGSLDNFFEVKEAAKLLGIKDNSLGAFLRRGKFPSAVKLKNKWYIPEEEILSYQAKKKTRQRKINTIHKDMYLLDGYLTLSEVTEKINLSRSRIYVLVNNGMFPNAKKVKGKWYVYEKDLDFYHEYKIINKNVVKKITTYPQNLPRGYLTKNEVSKILNITVSGVLALINRGKFKSAKKINKIWYIPESNILEYNKQKEKEQISITKPDLIYELKQQINDVQNKEYLKETFKFYAEFSTTKINATSGRVNNLRRVFNYLRRLFSELIIKLNVEIYDLSDRDIEAVLANKNYSSPVRELFLKFLKESLLRKGRAIDREYILSRKGKKLERDRDLERYSPKAYYLFEQHVKNIEKHISFAIQSRQYANMWVLTTMLLTNAWRPSDIIFEMPHIDIEVIQVSSFEWFKQNKLSQEQCQIIINQLYLKLNNAEVSKTQANLHFLVAPDMIKCLAYACIISELHCQSLQGDDTLFETERLLLGTFVPGITANPITSGTTAHQKFLNCKRELIPFSSKKLNNSTMTYLFLDICEDEAESEMALEVTKWIRSHEDINVTAGYVKLTNRDGSLERVSFNLFRRGHFGWLYNYMVQLAFSNLGVHQTLEERTKTIAGLRNEYSPLQIEEWAKALLDYKNGTESVVKRLYRMNKEKLKEIVLKIYRGKMPSRDGGGQCLSFPDCQLPNKRTCIGCVDFIPQLQQVLLEAKEEFNRLINSLRNNYTDAILKRDTVFLFNVLLIFNEAIETFGNDIVNGFLTEEERKTAVYSIVEKLKLPAVNL